MDDTFGYSFQLRSQRSEQRSMADLQTQPYEEAGRRAKEAMRGAARWSPTLWYIPEASGALDR
ncbi:hypothetical protein PVK06_017901 [Gossypium arboreum]|uniref:Uncharacterized protein n=1 Tax=Gossypium arboreum TaxID=29729 RepID=A0ABR0Q406_GOSAR|nr:hypothetical protein PVK06_017901 [Gossypium arboreum]